MAVSVCMQLIWNPASHAEESPLPCETVVTESSSQTEEQASAQETEDNQAAVQTEEDAEEQDIVVPIDIMAHRGFKEVFPENTLFSMESAMSVGFNGVEIDVWESENGNLMISHDKTTDRMCGVSDFIWHVNSSNRKNYPIPWNGMDLMIPTFTEVMEFTRDSGATVFLHIKTASGYKLSDDGVKKIIRLIKRYGVQDQVIVFATKEKTVKRFCGQGIRVGRISGNTDREVVNGVADWLYENGGDILFITSMNDIMLPDFGADLVEYCHNRGIKVGTYWTTTLQDLEYLISIGADFALTDYNLIKQYKEAALAGPDETGGQESTESTAETVDQGSADSSAEPVEESSGTIENPGANGQ